MDLTERRIQKQFDHQCDFLDLERKLAAAECTMSRAALYYGRDQHAGYRYDQVTPSYLHEITIALRMLSRAPALREAGIKVDHLIAIILTHDVPENSKTLTPEKMGEDFRRTCNIRFPQAPEQSINTVVEGAFGLSKYVVIGGMRQRLPNDVYYQAVAADPLRLLAKLGDFDHNTETLRYLPPEKQDENIGEALMFIDIAQKALATHPQIADLVDSYVKDIKRNISNYLETVELSQQPEWPHTVDVLRQKGRLSNFSTASLSYPSQA